MTLAKSLLNNPDVEITFIVDKEWEGKLVKYDDRFKFAVFEHDTSDQENRVSDMITKFEAFLKLPLLDRSIRLFTTVLEDKNILETDRKAGNLKQLGFCLLKSVNRMS